MFSATGLVAAFAVLALAINVVPTDTSPPSAGTGSTLSVAADGSGDFSTIAEAVAAAADGDTIMVRPGTYTEAIVIDKDITLMGDGPREEIVIRTEEPRPLIDIVDTDAVLSGLTLSGAGSVVNVIGGAPVLEDLWFKGLGQPHLGNGVGVTSLHLSDMSTATIVNNLFTEGGELWVDGVSAPLIEGNEFRDGPHIYLGDAADGTIVRNNVVVDNLSNAIGITGPGSPLIEGNTFDGSETWGVLIGFQNSEGVNPILRNNTITRAPIGVSVGRNAAPTFEGNDIDVPGIAINLQFRAEPVFSGNTICGGEAIVATPTGVPGPSLAGNDVCEVAATS